MGKYVVMAFATLHKDIIVEAESEDLAQAKVECAFADGRLEFSMDDFVADFNDYEVMTPDVALQLDGVAARRNVSGGVSGDSRAGDEGGRSPSEDQAL